MAALRPALHSRLRAGRRPRAPAGAAAMVAPLLYLLAFFAVPTLLMFAAAFRTAGDYGGLLPLLAHDEAGGWRLLVNGTNWQQFFTLDNLRRLVAEPVHAEIFLRSLGYAGLTTLVCLALGYPLAWLTARSPPRRRELLVLLVILPFWSNFLIRVYAWMILLGPEGALAGAVNAVRDLFGLAPATLLFSPLAVVIVLVYVHLPFMVLPLYANLEKHDRDLVDAARDLGAGPWQRFWRITWPLSLPGVWAGCALVAVPALGMFAVPDLVGGTSGAMIGNVIKQQFLDARDWPFGAALSLALTLAVLLIAAAAAGLARLGGRHA